MVHYKLHYFDLYGRAEPIRMMFHLAEQTFEDRRFSFAEWPEIKKNETPSLFLFGQGPILEVDDKKIAQSLAIYRFVANTFGFAGNSLMDRAQMDMIVDYYTDYLTKIADWYVVKAGYKPGDEEELRKTLLDPNRKIFFENLQGFIEKEGTGYIVGDKVSYADLTLLNHIDIFTRNYDEYLHGYPVMQDYVSRLRNLPLLREYLAERPDRPR
ncbi:unnamed protein product, partial [Mesorhabditis belari]|uniref:glutathione transferase n=1 Tax=Mesorhabditis belari TaxID=2138241 RepID=A0AAF3EPZ8_9BILA